MGKKILYVFLAGVLCLGMGIFVLVDANKDKKFNTLEVSATVIDYYENETYDSNKGVWDTEFSPILRYSVHYETYEQQYSQYYSKKEFEIGSEIKIKCNPNNPTEYNIVGDNRSTVISAWMIPVGILLIAYAIFPIIKAKK